MWFFTTQKGLWCFSKNFLAGKINARNSVLTCNRGLKSLIYFKYKKNIARKFLNPIEYGIKTQTIIKKWENIKRSGTIAYFIEGHMTKRSNRKSSKINWSHTRYTMMRWTKENILLFLISNRLTLKS